MDINITKSVTEKTAIPDKKIEPILNEIKSLVRGENFSLQLGKLAKVRYTIAYGYDSYSKEIRPIVKVNKIDVIDDDLRLFKQALGLRFDSFDVRDYINELKNDDYNTFHKKCQMTIEKIRKVASKHKVPEDTLISLISSKAWEEVRKERGI